MRILIQTFCFLAFLGVTSSFARADLVCDGEMTKIKRGASDPYWKWAEVGTFETGDFEILQLAQGKTQFEGYISMKSSPYFESFFRVLTVGEDKDGYGETIFLDLVAMSPDGQMAINLSVVRDERSKCLLYDLSDCYAGDTCSMKCLEEISEPKALLLKKRILCAEK